MALLPEQLLLFFFILLLISSSSSHLDHTDLVTFVFPIWEAYESSPYSLLAIALPPWTWGTSLAFLAMVPFTTGLTLEERRLVYGI